MLLDGNRWSAAYYVSGYAVECGLKACVLKRVADEPQIIYADKKFSEKCWTHSIEDLVLLANLAETRDSDAKLNEELKGNWLIVKDWKETARYTMNSEQQARKLYNAITHRPNGVMIWIRDRW